MKEPMIPIERASEATIMSLVKLGLLEIKDDGIHVVEKNNMKKGE